MLLDEKAYIAELERQNTEMLYAFDAMRQRYKAAEATGRAAVRALAKWRMHSDPADAATCVYERCQDTAAVLATDTAKRWLKEVPDGGTQSNC